MTFQTQTILFFVATQSTGEDRSVWINDGLYAIIAAPCIEHNVTPNLLFTVCRARSEDKVEEVVCVHNFQLELKPQPASCEEVASIRVTRGRIEPLTYYMWDVLEGVLGLGKNQFTPVVFPSRRESGSEEGSQWTWPNITLIKLTAAEKSFFLPRPWALVLWIILQVMITPVKLACRLWAKSASLITPVNLLDLSFCSFPAFLIGSNVKPQILVQIHLV